VHLNDTLNIPPGSIAAEELAELLQNTACAGKLWCAAVPVDG